MAVPRDVFTHYTTDMMKQVISRLEVKSRSKVTSGSKFKVNQSSEHKVEVMNSVFTTMQPGGYINFTLHYTLHH